MAGRVSHGSGCPICLLKKKAFVCPSCINASVQSKRRLVKQLSALKSKVEAKLQSLLIKLESLKYKDTRFIAGPAGCLLPAPSLPPAAYPGMQRRRAELEKNVNSKRVQLEKRRTNLQIRGMQVHENAKHLVAANAIFKKYSEKLKGFSFEPKLKRLSLVEENLQRSQKKIIQKFLDIYVIRRVDREQCSIVGIKLPDDVSRIDTAFQQESIGAAFGYVVIVLNQIAAYLGMAFPHTMVSLCSESFVIASPFDEINGGNKYELSPSPDNEDGFRYALFLLDQNISYLCARNGVYFEIEPMHILPNILVAMQAISLNFQRRQTKESTLLRKLRKKSVERDQHTGVVESQHSAWLLPKNPQRSSRMAECKTAVPPNQKHSDSESNRALLSPPCEKGVDNKPHERGWQLHSNYIGPGGDIQTIPASSGRASLAGLSMRDHFSSSHGKGMQDSQRSTTPAAFASVAHDGQRQFLESDSDTDSEEEWDVVDLTANQMRESIIHGQAVGGGSPSASSFS